MRGGTRARLVPTVRPRPMPAQLVHRPRDRASPPRAKGMGAEPAAPVSPRGGSEHLRKEPAARMHAKAEGGGTAARAPPRVVPLPAGPAPQRAYRRCAARACRKQLCERLVGAPPRRVLAERPPELGARLACVCRRGHTPAERGGVRCLAPLATPGPREPPPQRPQGRPAPPQPARRIGPLAAQLRGLPKGLGRLGPRAEGGPGPPPAAPHARVHLGAFANQPPREAGAPAVPRPPLAPLRTERCVWPVCRERPPVHHAQSPQPPSA